MKQHFSQRVIIRLSSIFLLAGIVLASSISTSSAPLAPEVSGALDTSFGSGGKVFTDFSFPRQDYGNAMSLRADGSFVVVGESYSSVTDTDFAVVFYMSNGTPWSGFSQDGRLLVDFGGSDVGKAVISQSDGKIIIVGQSDSTTLAMARLNTNGSLDTSFGVNGKILHTNFGTVKAAVLDSNGKIVVVGYTTSYDFIVARYNSDGNPDNTFGTSGKAITDFGSSYDYGYDVAIDSSAGKIIVVGQRYYQGKSDFALARYDSSGVLDATFSGGGRVIQDFGPVNEYARSVAIQSSDGKLVVAGSFGSYFMLARFNANGILDTTTFNSPNGFAVFSPSSGSDDLFDVAIQPGDGKIVATGASAGRWAVLRYTPSGYLDGSFNGSGYVFGDYNSGADLGNAVAIRSDGRILTAGYGCGGTCDFQTVQYASAGFLDGSFGSGGRRLTDFTYEYNNIVRDTALQLDNKILVAGYSDSGGGDDVVLARYATNGTLDSSFGNGGKVVTDFNHKADRAGKIAIQSDGKILVGAYATLGDYPDFALARYNTDGSLDTTFDTDGKVTIDLGGSDYGGIPLIQTSGKIVVAGATDNGSGSWDFAIVRYNINGSLDTTFGSGGKRIIDLRGQFDRFTSAILQPDDKILLAGYCYDGSQYDFCLARYTVDGSPDTSFDGDGKAYGDYANSDNNAYALSIQSDGKIVVAGDTYLGVRYFTTMRFNPNGSLDTSFGSNGVKTTIFGSGSTIPDDIVIQPDGRIIVAGYSENGSNRDFSLVRYTANGDLDTTFASGGILITNMFGVGDQVHSLSMQQDGKIIAAGESCYADWICNFALARYVLAPFAPTSLVATATGQKQITLTWEDNSSDEWLFSIERSLDGSSGWAVINSVGADVTTYQDNSIIYSTTYYYRVRAYRSSDATYSDYSNVASVTSQDNLPPAITETNPVTVIMDEEGSPTPFDLTLHATDPGNDTLTWSISSLANHGTATVSGTGTSKMVSYMPSTRYYGQDIFVVQVSDGWVTDSITVNVVVHSTGNSCPALYIRNSRDFQSALVTGLSTDQSQWFTWGGTTGEVELYENAKYVFANVNTNIYPEVSMLASVPTGTYRVWIYQMGSVINRDLETTVGVDAPVRTGFNNVVEGKSWMWRDINVHSINPNTIIKVKAVGDFTNHGQGIDQRRGAFYTILLTSDLSETPPAFDPDGQTYDLCVSSLEIDEGASAAVSMDEDGSPIAFSLTLHATDPDTNDILTWSVNTPATQGTASVSGTGTSKSIGYIPSLNYYGTDSFTVQVSDGGMTDTITVNVTIDPVNDPPTISDIVDQNIDEDTATGNISFTVGDVETDAVMLTVTAASSNQILLPETNITLGGSGVNRTIALTPTAELSGASTVTVTVTDGIDSFFDVFLITVNPVNDPPTISLSGGITTLAEDLDTSSAIKVADITITDDALGTNNLSLSGADAAMFEITGSELFLKAGSQLDFETNPFLDVTVEVDDPGVGSTPDDSDSMTISVTDVNEPPTVALSNTTTTLPENTDTSSAIKVADITITDDALGTNNLALSGADAALFEITGDELFLKAGAQLDFETNPSLDVTIEVDDPGVGSTPDDSDSLAIGITDIDEIPPGVDASVRADANPTNAASVQFWVTFSEPVNGVSIDDFTLATSGVTGAIVNSVTGSGDTYTVTVSTGTGDGTIRLDIEDDDSITDMIGNPLGGSGAGNGNYTGGEAYTIDKTAPDTNLTAQPDNPANSASATFEFDSQEGSAVFECQLDGGGYSDCVSPKTYNGLSDDTHTFYVRARDAAGNRDASPASHTWLVDTIAPSGGILIDNDAFSVLGVNVQLNLSAADGGSGVCSVQLRNSGETWGDWFDFTSLVDWILPWVTGEHTVEARYRDCAGNISDVFSDTITVIFEYVFLPMLRR